MTTMQMNLIHLNVRRLDGTDLENVVPAVEQDLKYLVVVAVCCEYHGCDVRRVRARVIGLKG